MTLQELLPTGVYPIWSPYDSQEAAKILLNALAQDQPDQPGIGA